MKLYTVLVYDSEDVQERRLRNYNENKVSYMYVINGYCIQTLTRHPFYYTDC